MQETYMKISSKSKTILGKVEDTQAHKRPITTTNTFLRKHENAYSLVIYFLGIICDFQLLLRGENILATLIKFK